MLIFTKIYEKLYLEYVIVTLKLKCLVLVVRLSMRIKTGEGKLDHNRKYMQATDQFLVPVSL